MAAQTLQAPFRVGAKELFLPKITIAFHRTPTLPANQAKFHVPLWFSKLDLRDYLYHVYTVRIVGVRSYVKQQRVTTKSYDGRPAQNRWHRPRAQKFMTVELERPFVWPEEPEDYSEWNKSEVEESEREREAMQEGMAPTADMIVNEERRKAMREQARKLLEGKVEWKPAPMKSSVGMLSR